MRQALWPPVHVIAARLGQAAPAITLRVYAHVRDDQASGVGTTFEQILNTTPAHPRQRHLETTSHAEFRSWRDPVVEIARRKVTGGHDLYGVFVALAMAFKRDHTRWWSHR